ncbi:MAG: hypothetical protein ACRC4L_02760, partial [Mycoplasma sp.]
YYVIDTPGFLSNDNLLSYIDHKKNKLVFNDKEIKPITYQIKQPKTLKVENLLQIDLFPTEDIGSATLYINSNLVISSSKLKDEVYFKNPNLINYASDHLKNIKWKTHTFEISKYKTDICVAGLGLVSLKNISKIVITIDENVAINELPFAII